MNTKDGQEYAWNWFEYHAGQRLVTFRFFLIFLGVLVVGFSTSLKDGHAPFASAIAYFGACISFAFLVLEIRNEQLVNIGRRALMAIEALPDFHTLPPELKLLHIDRERKPLLSHKCWLRVIYVACMVISLILAWDPMIVMGSPPGKST